MKTTWKRFGVAVVLVFLLGTLTGCATHFTIHKAVVGTDAHPLLKLWGEVNLAVECGPFEKFLDAVDAMWKAKLPTPVIDAEAIANAAATAAVKAVKAAEESEGG